MTCVGNFTARNPRPPAKPTAHAIAADVNAITVVLDLVDPAGHGRRLAGAARTVSDGS